MRRLEHSVWCYLCHQRAWLVYEMWGHQVCLMCKQHEDGRGRA